MKKLNRQYLQPGYKITFDNITYEIVKSIGAGANCVVYEALRADNEYQYRYYLKECYPFAANIVRNLDGSLEWTDNAEKEQSLRKFKNAYKTLLDIYNDESFRNSTSMPLDIYEANGTIYFLNDIKVGTTFAEDTSENLSDILATMIALSKLIGKYHKAGYLHLDIKPENIFLIDETRELLVLFDVDSVIPINLLRNGEIKHISFSANYAAPEQKREKLSEINEQTDIYSIGATLFYKIMGRYVTSLDRDIFATWNFDEIPMFDGVNPLVKKHIGDIFNKTLAVCSRNRYKSASELTGTLEEALSLCNEKQFLTSNYPSVTKNFVGRERELDKIKNAFVRKNNIVFLHGFGGIGKSELSKKFIYDNVDNYDVILFLKYNFSLENTLRSIPIGKDIDEKLDFSEKEPILERLLNKNVLLVIDNFDIDFAEDTYLCELSKFKANIIITTRTDFSALQTEGFEQIDILPIDKDSLKTLFITESGYNKISAQEQTFVDEILFAYRYHTLFVRPLAYKVKYMGYTIETLKNEVASDLLEDSDLIIGVQNNIPYEETLKSLAEKLFKIDDLDDIQKKILCDLYLLDDAKFDFSDYPDIVYKDSELSEKKQIKNTLIKMIRTGIVQNDDLNSALQVHPIILEIAKKKFIPEMPRCKAIGAFIHNKTIEILHSGKAYIFADIEDKDPYFESSDNIIFKLDATNENNEDYIINFLYDICKNRTFDYIISTYSRVFKKITNHNDNIKFCYLQFLNMINSLYRDFSESDVVNFICNFHKTKNDNSKLFSAIFWKMIIEFYSLLNYFDEWGWNSSVYNQLYKCISYEEEYGNSIEDYVYNYGDEYIVQNAYTLEGQPLYEHNWEFGKPYCLGDGKILYSDNCAYVPQYIREIYLRNERIINEYNIDTENKSGAEIYNECVQHIIGEYSKELDECLETFNSRTLSESEIDNIRYIYGNILSNPILDKHKGELLKSYEKLFLQVDTKLKYQTILNSGNNNMLNVFEDILYDKDEHYYKGDLLERCIANILKPFEDRTSYEAQSKVVACVSNHMDWIISKHLDVGGYTEVLRRCLLAYITVDLNEFRRIIDKLIENSIDSIKKRISDGALSFSPLSFTILIHKVEQIGKCHLLSSFLCEYADEIISITSSSDKKLETAPLLHLLKDCIMCSEAAFKETNDEKFKNDYINYKGKLKEIPAPQKIYSVYYDL